MSGKHKGPRIHDRPDFWNGPCNHITGYIIGTARELATIKKYSLKQKENRDLKLLN